MARSRGRCGVGCGRTASWPRVPITHVTNGVHLSSWIGPPMRRLFERYLGEGWWRGAHDPATWEAIAAVPDAELWRARCEQRAELVEFVSTAAGWTGSSSTSRAHRSRQRPGVSIPTCSPIGFARRNRDLQADQPADQRSGPGARLVVRGPLDPGRPRR